MHDADHRHQAGERGELAEGVVVQAGDDGHVNVTRTPAAALGEQHHRQLELVRQRQHAVLLVVVAPALGAGEYGVVVGHDHAARLLGAKLAGIDRAYTSHHAVGRRVGDQVIRLAPTGLRGHGQRAVFDEAAVGLQVAQRSDVFACRAPALSMALGHRRRAVHVQREGLTLQHAAQVGAHMVRVDRRRFHRGNGLVGDGTQTHQYLAFAQVGAGLSTQFQHPARRVGQQQVLHLHGFEHGDLKTRRYHVTNGDVPLHQPGRHRRAQDLHVRIGVFIFYKKSG